MWNVSFSLSINHAVCETNDVTTEYSYTIQYNEWNGMERNQKYCKTIPFKFYFENTRSYKKLIDTVHIRRFGLYVLFSLV